MWRFLNNVSRVFRQHVYNPRPSAVYVDEDSENLDRPETKKHRKSLEETDRKHVLNRLFVGQGAKKDKDDDTERERTSREWWHTRQNEFWDLLHGSHRMFEAITWGSAVIFGRDIDSYKRKTRLLYRVLFAIPGNDGLFQNLRESSSDPGALQSPCPSATAYYSEQPLAIKDAAGAAHDARINTEKTETLDSVMEEFHMACIDYTAQNHSLLGLQAVQEGDMAAAVDHLKSSCMLGNSSACFNLGLCYETGTGVVQNIEKATYYYKRAAKSGHSMAAYNLALMYLNESQKLEETDGARITNDDRSQGLSLMEQAARLGLPEALTYLGIYHINDKKDPWKAVPYFKAASSKNDSESHYYLAICYEKGLGVDVNECKAAQLYSLAASAGHDLATYNLAAFNQYGMGGIPKDEVSARALYAKAAQMGLTAAQDRLNDMDKNKVVDKIEYSNVDQNLTDRSNLSLPPALHISASSPNLVRLVHPAYAHMNLHGLRNMEKGIEPVEPGGTETGADVVHSRHKNAVTVTEAGKNVRVDVSAKTVAGLQEDNETDKLFNLDGAIFHLGEDETVDTEVSVEGVESLGFSPRSSCGSSGEQNSYDGESVFPFARYEMLRSQSYPTFGRSVQSCQVCQ